MSKITVVGVGGLGSCIAYEIANRGLANHLVLIDVYRKLAEGNAADISQATAFRSDVSVESGDYGDAKDSDLVVVTAGKPRTPEMKTRKDLLQTNKRIISEIALNLKQFRIDSMIITLTNPMDVMNYLMWKITGVDRKKIIGSGGMLDSARFRTVLSKELGVQVTDIEAYVIGEHGENQVPAFSQLKISGKRTEIGENARRAIVEKIRISALEVISKKGGTIYAPANNTVNMIETLLKDQKRLTPCSVVVDGEYRLKNMSIGVPAIVGAKGVEKILEWNLKEEEKTRFYAGASKLKEMIETLDN